MDTEMTQMQNQELSGKKSWSEQESHPNRPNINASKEEIPLELRQSASMDSSGTPRLRGPPEGTNPLIVPSGIPPLDLSKRPVSVVQQHRTSVVQLSRPATTDIRQRRKTLEQHLLASPDSPLQIVSQQPLQTQGTTVSDDAKRRKSFTSEERQAVALLEGDEELFMPNLQVEQYIPVRVARDKIKLILSEMAQMKSMHLEAVETMEKQHKYLKTQLETSVATYVRKLTADYNNRVQSLEEEYKKKLKGINATAMNNIHSGLDDAKHGIEEMEEKANARIKQKEAELERERKMFYSRMEEMRKQQGQGANDERVKELEDENEYLKQQLEAAKMSRKLDDDGGVYLSPT